MKLHIIFCSATLFITAVSTLHAHGGDNDPIFPTPDILRSNVAFWTKIYTEIPMSEGLLHDRDYPLVIFKRLSGEGSSKKVKEERRLICDALDALSSTPQSQWTDLQHRIVALYMKEADSGAWAGASNRVRFQQGQRERFREGLARSGMYIDTIRSILQASGVPLRLAYLPHVESSFNTEAYSKVGAAGLWQFMRGTANLYGMRINYTIDERRDPVTATKAAAKYLSSSYEQLGTWPLAITSYNHGVYGMKRAVNQTGSRDLAVIIKNYTSRSFQFASSNFYSCFLAASHIAENHDAFFPDVVLAAPLRYHDFTISHYIGADEFCRYLDIPRQDLIKLNPAIRPAVFSKHQRLPSGLAIHIPANRPIAQIASAYDAIPDSLKEKEPPRPQYYRVNRGDNLYGIANRLGVSINELAYENNITRLSRIRAGQVLRIPAKGAAVADLSGTKGGATTQKESKATGSPSSDAAVEIARAEVQSVLPPEEAAIMETSTVAQVEPPNLSRNDSEECAAKTTPTEKVPSQPATPLADSLREIAFASAITEAPTNESVKPKITASFDVALYDLDVVLSPVGTSAGIIVSVDETIGHYADWLGIPTWRIRKLNDMGRTSSIRINKKLLVPIDRPDALEQFAAARLEYHMAIEEDFYTQHAVSDVASHTLRRGETLWDICNNSDNPLPLWLFRKYNRHIDLNRLTAGTEVWVPQVRELTPDEIAQLYRPETDTADQAPAQPLIHLRQHRMKLTQ